MKPTMARLWFAIESRERFAYSPGSLRRIAAASSSESHPGT
jgi:hypothetical protein